VPEPLPVPAADGVPDPEAHEPLWLEEALAQLPLREREVIELAYFADLSQTQIAQRLGVPLGTVKSWTRRGLNRLALLLDEEAGA
jgi:RNA polymerase sigma factor (sigma-70 family)